MRFKVVGDGSELHGRSYTEVVAAMATLKLDDVTNLKRYRKSTAARVQEMYDEEIDPSSDEKFVKSLVKAGVLEKSA